MQIAAKQPRLKTWGRRTVAGLPANAPLKGKAVKSGLFHERRFNLLNGLRRHFQAFATPNVVMAVASGLLWPDDSRPATWETVAQDSGPGVRGYDTAEENSTALTVTGSPLMRA